MHALKSNVSKRQPLARNLLATRKATANTVGFADYRTDTVAQRILRGKAAHTLWTRSPLRFKEMADLRAARYRQTTGLPAQCHGSSGSTPGVVQRVGKVGEQPEAFGTQLASRIKNIWSEAGLEDNDTLKQTLKTRIVNMAGLRRPDGITNVRDIIRAAIFDSLPKFGSSLDVFFGAVLGKIAAVWQDNPVKPSLDLCAKYFEHKVNNRANALIHQQVARSGNKELGTAAEGLRFDRDEIDDNKFTKLAQNFNQRRPVNVTAPFNLSTRQRGLLVKALKSMPAVKEILAGTVPELSQIEMATSARAMKWLHPDVSAAKDSKLTPKVTRSIQQAMAKIVTMVDPNVLAALPVPKVVVHRNTGVLDAIKNRHLSDMWGYRSRASRAQMTVTIAEDESVPVIVHEIGHQLEYFLGTSHWMNIQKLIRSRHAQAGGNGTLKRIYPMNLSSDIRKEPAYRSPRLPVTGTYSMKHNMGGSTEIFSMTMQYFSTPEEAKTLIENDPLQAAIILDAIQPDQFFDHLPPALYHLFPNRFIEMQEKV